MRFLWTTPRHVGSIRYAVASRRGPGPIRDNLRDVGISSDLMPAATAADRNNDGAARRRGQAAAPKPQVNPRGVAWHEAPLRREHDRGGFDCGTPALNEYLQRYARQSHECGGAKTFVAVPLDTPTVIPARTGRR